MQYKRCRPIGKRPSKVLSTDARCAKSCVYIELGCKTMHRPSIRQVVFAFIAGLVLVPLALYVGTILADFFIYIPNKSSFQAQGWGGHIFQKILLMQIPMTILAGIFAFVIFRLLSSGGTIMWLALSSAWFMYCVAAELSIYRGSTFSILEILWFLLITYKWISVLTVPLGVWIASRLSKSKLSDAD
jgi:hypothetical protein